MDNTNTYRLSPTALDEAAFDAGSNLRLYAADHLVVLDRKGPQALVSPATDRGERLSYLPPMWVFSDEIELA